MRHAVKLASICCAVVLLAACGSYHFPGGSSTGTGTVTGKVTAVPCAPVEQVDSPCAGRLVANLDFTFTSDSTHEKVKVRTDSAGNYTVELAAGSWSVAFQGIMRIIDGPKSVTVKAGQTIVANYVLDSGIRVPAAAGSSPSSP